MHIKCSECGAAYRIPDQKLTRTINRATCVKCGVKMIIRRIVEEAEVGPPTPHPSTHADLDSEAPVVHDDCTVIDDVPELKRYESGTKLPADRATTAGDVAGLLGGFSDQGFASAHTPHSQKGRIPQDLRHPTTNHRPAGLPPAPSATMTTSAEAERPSTADVEGALSSSDRLDKGDPTLLLTQPVKRGTTTERAKDDASPRHAAQPLHVPPSPRQSRHRKKAPHTHTLEAYSRNQVNLQQRMAAVETIRGSGDHLPPLSSLSRLTALDGSYDDTSITQIAYAGIPVAIVGIASLVLGTMLHIREFITAGSILTIFCLLAASLSAWDLSHGGRINVVRALMVPACIGVAILAVF